MAVSPIELADVPGLIGKAFAVARASQRPDWQRMSIAVLKNRLLDLTQRRFDESQLGFESFRELLASFSDLVRLDYTTRPATVEFLGAANSPTAPSDSRLTVSRVRRDLWNAIFDYSAGQEWVWDTSTGTARPIQDGDDPVLVLPTTTADELKALRDAFAEEVRPLLAEDPRDSARLLLWTSKGLGTAALPMAVRGMWNERLKAFVVERLTSWFAGQDIPGPDDLLIIQEGGRSAGAAQEELRALQGLVIECVRSMTLSELASLKLPASAVIRVHRVPQRNDS